MLKILSVLGTRPEAIKLAPIIKEFTKHSNRLHSFVCSTGQHREMLDQVLALFEICPDHDLHLMQPNQSLAQLTARLFTGLDQVVHENRPDWILAQGDTTTAFVSAMVAFYHGVPFGHVEAGLRTGNRRHPFPEEINGELQIWLPMSISHRRKVLAKPSFRKDVYQIPFIVTGNTVVDALKTAISFPYDWESGPLGHINPRKKLVCITAHRRESFGESFRQICLAIRDLAQRFNRDSTHFVYPVHLNPNVIKPVYDILNGLPNVSLIEPLDYLSLINLVKRSVLVLTDSGGIQEEAPSLGVPVLVMRQTTERPEGVTAGVVKLVGTDRFRIVEEASPPYD